MAAMKNLTRDSDTVECFVSKQSALNALRELFTYLGTPPATGKALEWYLNLRGPPDDRATNQLRLAVARLGDCHSTEAY